MNNLQIHSSYRVEPSVNPDPAFVKESMVVEEEQYYKFRTGRALFQDQPQSEEFPEPKKVLYRSMMIPGWGQVINKQVWKVPIIYALFVGLGYYTYDLTRQYHGFRAAYYNEIRGEETDYRFGETPGFVPDGMSADQMRVIRDNLRNDRDLSYIYIGLAYGLNILDAYVYAHMRSFDVSDDLSANASLGPGVTEFGTPGVRLKIGLVQNGSR